MPSFDIPTDKANIQANEPAQRTRSASLGGDSPLQGRLRSISDPDISDIGPHELPLTDNPPQQGWEYYRKRMRPLNPPSSDEKEFAEWTSSNEEHGPPGPRPRSRSLPTISPNPDLQRKSPDDVDEIAPRRTKATDQYTRQAHRQRHTDHLAQKNLSRNVKSAFNPHTSRFSSTSRYRWAKGYEQSLMQTADHQSGDVRPADLKQRIWNRHGGPPQSTQQRLWGLRDEIQHKISSLNRVLGFRANENPFLHVDELQQEVQANPLTARPAARKIVALHQELLELGIDPYQDLEQLKSSIGKDRSVARAYDDRKKLKDFSDAVGKMAQPRRGAMARGGKDLSCQGDTVPQALGRIELEKSKR
jgi:hypothetical protein